MHLIGEVRLNIDEPVSLDSGVVVPPGTLERLAIDDLVQVVHRGDLDGGVFGVPDELPEHPRARHNAPAQPRQDLVAFRHDVHGKRRAGCCLAQTGKRVARRQPWLVRQHVESRFVQARDGGKLVGVSPGQHDSIAASLFDEAGQGIVCPVIPYPPVSRVFLPGVEGVDQAEKALPIRAGVCIDMHVGGDTGIVAAQGQCRVKMARFVEQQRVHVTLRHCYQHPALAFEGFAAVHGEYVVENQ